MLLKVSNATVQFAGEDLFRDVNLEIKNTEKVAIIGRNGCGKTTLLKAIIGQQQLDQGQIIKGSEVTLGYLSQRAFEDENLTVRQAFDQMYEHILSVKKEMDEIAEKLEDNYDEKLVDRYGRLQQEFELSDGYNYNQQQMMLFRRFGFDDSDLDRQLSSFSGGQKTRIAFVKLLLVKPDILLLDEPTNHLDMQTVQWLEDYLKRYPKAIILVSHDRMFIDRVVNEVYEFEFGRVNHYSGNYTRYVELKKQQLERQQIAYRNQQAEIKRLEELIEKFRYKKNKAAFAQSKIKYLERMDRIEKPKTDEKGFKLKFDRSIRGGNMVLLTDDLTIGYEKPLCSVTIQVNSGDKLAVIGPNGLGKSTFVKTLMGQVKALKGDYLFGHQIQVAYFDQQLAQIDSEKTVLDELWDLYPQLDHTAIRKVLGSFLFTADDVFKSCNVLSGGEKVRLTLAKIMLSHANLLILDEPTNHLDIAGKEALENALMEYDGTVIFVSHDRYFINKLATSILYINDRDTKYYPLTYSEYQDKINGTVRKEEEKKPEVQVQSNAKTSRENAKKAASLEKQIARAEQQLEQLRELRYDEQYYHDYQKLNELEEQIDAKHNEIDNLMTEWENYAD